MLQRQTYNGPVRWVVVDDGAEASQVTLDRPYWEIEVVRPKPFWELGQNTQGRNLLAGLEVAGGTDVLTVWEDDDWYHEDWLQFIADHIHEAELIGEERALYYNVFARRYNQLKNTNQASLRCSAMRGAAIKTFRECLAQPHTYYDSKLWHRHSDKKLFPQRLTIGLKGLPGRPGIATGHDGKGGHRDKDGSFLRSKIGSDWDWYADFYKDRKMAEKKLICVKPFRFERRDYKPGDVFQPKKRIDAELHIYAKKVVEKTFNPEKQAIKKPAEKRTQPKADKPPLKPKVNLDLKKQDSADEAK